jgi:hypothetical protein
MASGEMLAFFSEMDAGKPVLRGDFHLAGRRFDLGLSGVGRVMFRKDIENIAAGLIDGLKGA